MKQILRKTFLTLVGGIFLSSGAWAEDLPTPVYFNTFDATTGLTVVGTGAFETDADARFGKIYHNNTEATTAQRTNYLQLPADVLSHSATSKEMTIGFWVNVKNATAMTNDAKFFFSPILSAYALTPAENAAASRAGNEGNFPMFVCQTRGLLQLNNGGWCDFGKEFNDDANKRTSDNTASTAWLDDAKWHYYTVVLTSTTAKIYIDGTILNSWTVDGTSEGQIIEGFFTYGGNYKCICLGGNQAWNWGDPDPAFGFDDFAVYDKALTVAQINKIIANKSSVTKEISSTGWSTFAYDYPLDFTTPISGLSAYAVTGHSGTAITKEAVTGVVPAGTPLLLNGTASTSYTIPVATSAGTAPTGNKLVRGADAAVSATSGNTTYVLSKDGTKAVFKKIDTTPATVAKNQAYLLFNEVIAARSIDVDGDGTTYIQNLKVGKEDNVYYDLQGRRVLYPKKGLYIVNGKKVIINK